MPLELEATQMQKFVKKDTVAAAIVARPKTMQRRRSETWLFSGVQVPTTNSCKLSSYFCLRAIGASLYVHRVWCIYDYDVCMVPYLANFGTNVRVSLCSFSLRPPPSHLPSRCRPSAPSASAETRNDNGQHKKETHADIF